MIISGRLLCSLGGVPGRLPLPGGAGPFPLPFPLCSFCYGTLLLLYTTTTALHKSSDPKHRVKGETAQAVECCPVVP